MLENPKNIFTKLYQQSTHPLLCFSPYFTFSREVFHRSFKLNITVFFLVFSSSWRDFSSNHLQVFLFSFSFGLRSFFLSRKSNLWRLYAQWTLCPKRKIIIISDYRTNYKPSHKIRKFFNQPPTIVQTIVNCTKLQQSINLCLKTFPNLGPS